MANFDMLAARGAAIFLRYDQAEMIRRFGLQADEEKIYVNFIGERLQLDRAGGAVTGADGRAAGPAATLTVYDMLCRDTPPCGLAGSWRTTNMLPGAGQSNPDDTKLHRGWAQRLERNPEALRRAGAKLGGEPFPIGDAAFVLPVFDWFPVVFQLWCGDEEFPPSMRFLWDANALRYLRYETLYYVMGEVLERLARAMEEPV